MIDNWKWYFRELRSTKCQCGNAKGRGKSFCLVCFKSLPTRMQTALYKRLHNGYEEAYDDALSYLNKCR